MLKKEEVGVCDGACDGACDDTADDKQDGVTLQCIRSIRGTRTPLAPLTIVIIIGNNYRIILGVVKRHLSVKYLLKGI